MTEAGYSPQEHGLDESELPMLMGENVSKFIYANPASLKISGYAWEEIKDTDTAKMMHPDTMPQVRKDKLASPCRSAGGRRVARNPCNTPINSVSQR
jgi:PAS domain S-box-containing protein